MPNGKDGSSSLRVEVRDVRGEVIGDAAVTLVPRDPGAERIELRFDDGSGTYASADLAGGHADLEVQHERLEGQRREVQIGEGLNHELFILGEPGTKTYFREKVRVPVDADPDLIGVTLVRQGREDTKLLDALADGLELEPQEVPDLARRAGVVLFRSSGTSLGDILERLSEHPLVEHAGAVVGMREEGFSHLTRDVVVRFRGPRIEEVRRIAKEHGYAVVRDLVYAPGAYVLRWNGPASLDILDSIEQLAERDDVEWAEPSLVVTPEVDAVTPTEATWGGLWDRQLIGLADAWQHLQDAGLDTFGDPDIILAVWDSGVQSVGGVPTNDDFAGNLSDGSAKVFATFDFENMVANNDTPWLDHGSGVAGGASARANNPSPVAGESYGVVGSAPNVKIMTVAGRLPYIDIEVADQYIWMAGFDPQSPIAGFPAPLSNGADVITCSLTPGAGAPLSGTARATLDFVTTFGRAGKGTLCFFSTGNQNQNNVTARPYGAYEKCFAIAGTSLGNDGVTEVRAPFSGWGQIALCAPTEDTAANFHNPPANYKAWSADHAGQGNLISFRQTQTATTAAAAAGATTLTVASVAGFAVNAVIQVGAFGTAGSEPARVTAVNAGTNELTVTGWSGSFAGGLVNAHPAGSAVMTGPANHRNDFGGTSYATPLAAGVGALVLSANPALTFVEAREVLRMTAVKFDLANTDPVGQWLDANGNPSTTSGQPPVRSGWYGYGRVNAAGAVQTALTFAQTRDLVIRDNLADVGAVASSGTFWNSPDIWCRRLDPGMDPGALPANYTTQGPHEAPLRGQQNWVYLRVRNNGSQASLDAWVRVSVTHYPGMEFTYPDSWQPTQGPGDPIPSPMTPGTYFIGEAKVTGVAAGADTIVSIPWPVGLIPPEDVATPSGNVHWHPCLLAEITPHDGPVVTGNHVWDDNNLAQKNISIVGTDAGSDFAVANVVGNELNDADFLYLEVSRGSLPAGVQLFVDLMDPLLRRRLREIEQKGAISPIREIPSIESILRPQRPGVAPSPSDAPAATMTKMLRIPKLPWLPSRRHSWKIGLHDGREVAFLNAAPRAQVPVMAGPGRLSPVIVGGIVGSDVEPGEYEIVLVQRLPSGEVSGSATISLTIGRG